MRPPVSMPIVLKTAGMTAAMMDANPPTQTASASASMQWHVTMSLRMDSPPADERGHDLPFQLPSREGGIASFGLELPGIHDPWGLGVHDRHVGVRSDGQGAFGQPERARRLDGQRRHHLL